MEKYSVYKFYVIVMLLAGGCDQAVSQHTTQEQIALDLYLKRIEGDLVFMQGGTFWMGDFCPRLYGKGAYCSSEEDTRPLHEVELSSFSIGRFKVTHEDYDFYLKMAGLPKQHFDKEWRNKSLAEMTYFANSPASMTWTEADNYCRWLKQETGLPFALPTEAQWEYAARGRGKLILVATDSGEWRVNKKTRRGENFATDEDRQATEEEFGVHATSVRYAVDKYPPTPAGLYGMSENGYEWVNDWYDPDYYSRSPKKDPPGPEKTLVRKINKYLKVRRGGKAPSPGFDVGLTFFRGYNIKDKPYPDGTTVRCALNSAEPLK